MASGVSSKITLNKMAIRKLSRAQITALEKTAEVLHTSVVQEQVVPRDTGALQNESFFVDYSDSSTGRVSLAFSTPYARRLYFHPEYNFDKKENPNAQGKWLEPWINGSKKDFCNNAYRRFYKKESGI